MTTRREFLTAACGAVAALYTLPARAFPPLPPVSASALLVSSAQGLVFLDFGLSGALPPDLFGSGDLTSQLTAGLVDLLQVDLGTALPRVRTGKKSAQKVAQLARKHLQRGNKHHHPHATDPVTPLDAAAVDLAFTTEGLTLAESLSVQLSFGSTAQPTTYTTALSGRQSFSGGAGVRLQMDYSSSEGALFAALLRDVTTPGTGLLSLTVQDATLAAQLAEFGLTNADAAGGNVAVPLQVTLTGSDSGDHATPLGTSFTSVYLAVPDLFGVAIPADLNVAVPLAR